MPKNKPLKILFLCSWYPNRTNKTLGNFIQKHAEAISKIHQVDTLCLVSDPNCESVECIVKKNNNVREIIVYYPSSKNTLPIINNLSKIRRQFTAFKIGWKKVIEDKKPDLTHLNVIYPIGLWAMYLKKRKNIPYIITEHSSGFQNKKNAYSKTILSFSKKVLSKAEYIIPVSEDLKSHLQKVHPGNNYRCISNVVNKNIFNPGISNTPKKQFIHVSTAYEPAKNILGIVKTIKALSLKRKDFNLQIISDGDTLAAHELARELGILNSFVVFHDTKTTEEIAKMYHGKEALILFSNFENFPCVIPEAWMSGIPVIATSVNGIPEYVNSSNGILIEPKDQKALENAMNSILDNNKTFDPEKLRSYAIDHFSYEAIAEQYNSIYQKIKFQH